MDIDNLKVVLIQPLYQQNLGYIARVLKNFGIKNLYMVKPRCNHKGKQAIKYSKHAHELLEHAKIYKNLEEATNDCAFVMGTTALWAKSDGAFYNIYTPKKAKSFIPKNKKVALLIGRDDIGLTKEELRACDATVFIQTNKEYPVLNISHALAIMLYELLDQNKEEKKDFERYYADEMTQSGIVKLFSNFIKNRKDIRDKKSVALAFKHVITRSSPTKKELNAISVALTDKKKQK